MFYFINWIFVSLKALGWEKIDDLTNGNCRPSRSDFCWRLPAEDEEDAIRIANGSNYGLSGSVLTHDADAAYNIARQVRTGTIGQNGIRLELGVPFGGFKQSGIGREGGEEGLMAYLETKTILLDATPKQFA